MNPYSQSPGQIPPQSYMPPTTGYEPNAMTAAAPPGLGPDAALDWYLAQHRQQQTAPATAFHTAAQTPLPLQNIQPARPPSLLQAFGMQQGPMFTEQDLRVPQSANMLYGLAPPSQPAMPSFVDPSWTSPQPQVTSWTLPILGADRPIETPAPPWSVPVPPDLDDLGLPARPTVDVPMQQPIAPTAQMDVQQLIQLFQAMTAANATAVVPPPQRPLSLRKPIEF
jgi:hypothetical protein